MNDERTVVRPGRVGDFLSHSDEQLRFLQRGGHQHGAGGESATELSERFVHHGVVQRVAGGEQIGADDLPVELVRGTARHGDHVAHRQLADLGAYSDATIIEADLPDSAQHGRYELRRRYQAPTAATTKPVVT